MCDICHNRKGNSLYQYPKKSLDRNNLLYPVKDKYDICDYNPKIFMSQGWMNDDIIVELFMNASHVETFKFNNILFSKIKDSNVLL